MKKTIRVSIPSPCHQNWQDMTPAEKGRFCASCQKNVVDFSRSSDREIAKAISENKHLCGRFRADQVDRNLFVPKEKSRWWAAAGAAVLGFTSLLGTSVAACTSRLPQEQLSATPHGDIPLPDGKPEKIKGKVTDEEGNVLVNAQLLNTRTGITAVTDEEGGFEMEAAAGDTIRVHCPGHETKEVVFDGRNMKRVKLEKMDESDMILGGLG